MRILGINHIGLAPKDPAKTRWFFETVLGLGHLGDELVTDQRTLTRMYASETEDSPLKARLEILEPECPGEGPIGDYLDKKGSGIHHIALCVDNVAEAIERMKAHQVKMIDLSPRHGAHRTKIAFVHPHSTGGLLVELVEES